MTYKSALPALGGPFDVSLKWVTPDADAEIGHMARVSNPKAQISDPAHRLIGYLLRKSHWSPFQMANMCVTVATTRDISAQILRHQSMAFQEFSTRYAEVEEIYDTKECRFQDTKNRQNSFSYNDVVHGLDLDTPSGMNTANEYGDTVDWWERIVRQHAGSSVLLYQEALQRGVAKECARVLLPIGLCPTTMYINGTVRSWIHYIALRADAATQKEHRHIAECAYTLLQTHLPDTTRAFDAWHNTELIKERLYTLIMNADDQGTIDLMSDAMSDVHDMDTGVGDFAKAALAALVKEVSDGHT